jgi:alkylated DNA repair dioxygenase AlkB
MPTPSADAGGRRLAALDLPDGEIAFDSAFFSATEADRLLGELRDTTAWRQDTITFFGKTVEVPRLATWYGDEGTRYVYSGIENVPLPWTPALSEVKRAVEPASGVVFNGVLLNRCRSGKDSVSWHADDEPEFGERPVIGSVSLGGTRSFRLGHKTRKELKATVELAHGSLLIMRGDTQANWLHRVPKTARAVEERLNLTSRRVVAPTRSWSGPSPPTHVRSIAIPLPCPTPQRTPDGNRPLSSTVRTQSQRQGPRNSSADLPVGFARTQPLG